MSLRFVAKSRPVVLVLNEMFLVSTQIVPACQSRSCATAAFAGKHTKLTHLTLERSVGARFGVDSELAKAGQFTAEVYPDLPIATTWRELFGSSLNRSVSVWYRDEQENKILKAVKRMKNHSCCLQHVFANEEHAKSGLRSLTHVQ